MKDLKNGIQNIVHLELLSNDDLKIINGGGFAYDFGFFCREVYIGIKGGMFMGPVDATTDVALHYHPRD